MPGLEQITINNYHIQRLLKRGGMSEVYLAYDEQRQCEVAIKVVHSTQVGDIKRFQREVKLISTLTHDHILPIFDSGTYDQWQYMVMPYIEQGTLLERLAQRPMTQTEAAIVFEQITSALQYAHDCNIIHRDIKPTNILQRDEQYVYLADFGVAKMLGEETNLTQTNSAIGTPKYMAPELLFEPASTFSDVYALGILLYQMLTGQTPFEGTTSFEILEKHKYIQPIPPSVLNPAISPPVEQVILCALEKDPHRRFQTPQAMAQAYRQALTTTAMATTEPRMAIPLIPHSRSRTPMAITALIACVILLGAALLLSSFESRSATPTIRGTSTVSINATQQLQKTSPVIPTQSLTPTPANLSPTPIPGQQNDGNGNGDSQGNGNGQGNGKGHKHKH